MEIHADDHASGPIETCIECTLHVPATDRGKSPSQAQRMRHSRRRTRRLQPELQQMTGPRPWAGAPTPPGGPFPQRRQR